jgi:hypothetical protein
VNDTTQLKCSRGSDLDPKVMDTMLENLNPNPMSPDFIIPPVGCTPICLDQLTQTKLLKGLPILDDIDIAVRQVSDQSRGVQIPGIDTAGG